MKKLKILLLGLTLVSISSMVKCGQLYVKNCMNKNINLDITTTNNKTNNMELPYNFLDFLVNEEISS